MRRKTRLTIAFGLLALMLSIFAILTHQLFKGAHLFKRSVHEEGLRVAEAHFANLERCHKKFNGLESQYREHLGREFDQCLLDGGHVDTSEKLDILLKQHKNWYYRLGELVEKIGY